MRSPLFSMILRVIRKIVIDKAEGIVVVPKWATQPWFPLLQKIKLDEIEFGPDSKLVSSPFGPEYPMQLTLVAMRLSGKLYKSKEHLSQQSKLLWSP